MDHWQMWKDDHSCLLSGNDFQYLVISMIFGHISLAFLQLANFLSMHGLQTVGGILFHLILWYSCNQHYNLKKYLAISSNIFSSDNISFFTLHPDATSPSLNALSTVCRPQVPRSINVARFSSLLFSPSILRKHRFTFAPSDDDTCNSLFFHGSFSIRKHVS